MVKLSLIPVLALCLMSCHHHDEDHSDESHGHSHESSGHSHEDDDHSHAEPQTIQITKWNDSVEFFVEYPPFVAGYATPFTVHVTHLMDWKPRESGQIYMLISKEGERTIEVHDRNLVAPGIYAPEFAIPTPGKWRIDLRAPMPGKTNSILIDVTVYATHDDVINEDHSEDSATITFLKEQQWNAPFSSNPVQEESFRATTTALGKIVPRSGSEAFVQAPVNGALAPPSTGFPHIGKKVVKDQVLATVLPRSRQSDDPTVLKLAVEKAELAFDFALKEMARIKRLVDKEALPKKRLHDAENDVKGAETELKAARERYAQYASGSESTRLKLKAPISGTVIQSLAVTGSVSQDDQLFHIIDLDQVWLELQVPESQIGATSQTSGAWFYLEGINQTFETDRLIARGGVVDAKKRTAPLIFELSNTEGLFKIGMFAQAHILTGQIATGISVPQSALIEDAGQTYAFVQTGGETFERRTLQLGIRDGSRYQVLSGLEADDRVVTQGAWQVYLATSSTSLPAHGHAH